MPCCLPYPFKGIQNNQKEPKFLQWKFYVLRKLLHLLLHVQQLLLENLHFLLHVKYQVPLLLFHIELILLSFMLQSLQGSPWWGTINPQVLLLIIYEWYRFQLYPYRKLQYQHHTYPKNHDVFHLPPFNLKHNALQVQLGFQGVYL